jgi:hypothetical protein
VVSYSLVSYERAFNFLKSRSAALRPIKPKAGWMGAAARGSPPRHAKRASGAPGLRRKERNLFESCRHDYAALTR